MPFELSINPLCRGKDKDTVGLKVWQTRTFTASQLAQWAYHDGMAYCHATFRDGAKDNTHWLQAEIITFDIDDYTKEQLSDIQDAGGVIPYLLMNDFVRRHAVMIKASSSYTPTLPKVHLVFAFNMAIQTIDAFERLRQYIAAQLPVDVDRAGSRASQATFGTQFTNERMVKDDCLIYANDNYEALRGVKILGEIHAAQIAGEPYNGVTFDRVLEQHKKQSVRAEKHYEQPEDRRLTIVFEALSYALKDWGRRDYSDWLALWMSAYDGSDGHNAVRDYILDHLDVYWSDSKDRALFREQWKKHKPRDGGERKVTVASLFHYARLNGWFARTSADLTEDDYDALHIEDIGAWLNAEQPERLLLMSDTGTGKTRGAIQFIKDNLADGRAVLFAPTIKLCMNLSATLTAQGIENTLYIEDGKKILDSRTLRDASVLVTTLQTYGTKISRALGFAVHYDIVIIDEADDLISSFVRGGLHKSLGSRSHVSARQARDGITALSHLMQTAAHVILLDGTATKVSLTALQRLSGAHAVRCVKNTHQLDKAPVVMLPTIHDARERLSNTVQDGLRVVVACDTQAEAHRVYEFIKLNDYCDEDDMILITGRTSHQRAVRSFFEDVNAAASQYRVVIYNSAMGSGVSITDVKPDVIIQFATYLSPRKNLQILNRYRQQADVYVYVNPKETLYTLNVSERVANHQTVIKFEQSGLLEGVSRNDLARYTDEIARLAIADELEQDRNKYWFYYSLLTGECRTVHAVDPSPNSDAMREAFIDVYEVMKEHKEYIYENWIHVKPLDHTTISDEKLDQRDVSAGYLHEQIRRRVVDVEKALEDRTPSELAELVQKYKRYIKPLKRWLEPETAYDETIKSGLTASRPKVGFRLWSSQLMLLELVNLLFEDTEHVLSDDEADDTAAQFVEEVGKLQEAYDTLVSGYRKRYAAVIHEDKEPVKVAMKLAKYILAAFGLKLYRKQRMVQGDRHYVYAINAAPLLDLLHLSGYDGEVRWLSFDPSRTRRARHDARQAVETYKSLTVENRALFISALGDDLFIDAIEQFTNPL